ncbi:MAG: hypothetical protein QW262_08065 [Candidatus Bathyarchaeia archaeon]
MAQINIPERDNKCTGLSKSSSYSLTVNSAGRPSVSLSARGGSGLSFSFSPSSGTPYFTSTLTISASSSASLGAQTVTVTGSGGGISRSNSLTAYINDFSASVSPSSGEANVIANYYINFLFYNPNYH